MPHSPGLFEIFSSQSQAANSSFHYGNQESKVQMKLNKKTVVAPMPPMKKFGAYKPKILSGTEDSVAEVETTDKSSFPQKTAPAPLPPSPALDTSEQEQWGRNSYEYMESSVPNVIGEKEIEESSNIYETYIPNEDGSPDHDSGSDTLHPDYNESGSSSKPVALQTIQSDRTPLLSEIMNKSDPTFVNPAFSDSGNGNTEPDCYIPEPDYEEDEQTMDFGEEDPDDVVVQKGFSTDSRRVNDTGMKYYDGEDLSKYLSDDDDDSGIIRGVENRRGSTERHVGSESRRASAMERNSLFKSKTTTRIVSKRKKGRQIMSPASNNVRSFSYADSKFGSNDKNGINHLNMNLSEFPDEGQKFLSCPDSSYESFLRSRHGETILPVNSGDTLDKSSFAQVTRKEDPLWKKLTVRLKHKVRKNSSGSGY